MNHERELIVFCDESEAEGRYYSNFYGGLVVGSSHYERVTKILNDKKDELNLYKEIKWSKVTDRYLQKYDEVIKCFFEQVHAGNVKVRIMFSQNALRAVNLSPEDRELGYFKLYYQFIKHAFGLSYFQPASGSVNLRLYFDQFPDTREKAEQFKGYLLGLGSSGDFRRSGIVLQKENITEVRSHDHVLLQCLDILLGAISFRLNDRHRSKNPQTGLRGSRTVAKEKLYKTILSEIRRCRPNFNIGESTGIDGNICNRWNHSYRHWKFQSKDHEYRSELTKRKQKK